MGSTFAAKESRPESQSTPAMGQFLSAKVGCPLRKNKTRSLQSVAEAGPLEVCIEIEVFLVSGEILVCLEAMTTWTGSDVRRALYPHLGRDRAIARLSLLQSGIPLEDANQLKDVF